MPLLHTGRSKSRSPLPPSTYKVSLSPRPFLPPSHYAAAAGITYGQETEPYEDDESKQSRRPNDQYSSEFMPVTYPSDAESTSDSSFESKPKSPGEARHTAPTKASRRGRRQSLINDLPQLEANLLPSLRDTIHRMTRSPSRGGATANPGNISYLGVPGLSGGARSSRSPSPSGLSNHNSSVTSYLEEYPTSGVITPEPEPLHTNESAFVTSANVLTPRKNIPTKQSLKSSLRPPTPKLLSKTSYHSPSTSTVSSKSVRSILKKTSTHNFPTSTDPAASGTTRKSSMDQGPKPFAANLRARSRTDPGSAPAVSFEDEKNPAPTPRTAHTASSITKPSSIPRLQTKHIGSQAQWSTDESDLENRYEDEGRDRRQLVIANAEVSSSSSEDEVERWDRAGGRGGVESRNNRRNSHGETQGIGLGIDLGSGTRRNRSSVVFLQHQNEGASLSQEVNSVRSTCRMEEPETPARPPRSPSRPPSKNYKADQNSVNVLEASQEQQRRQAALLGIVSRLDLGRQQTPGGRESGSDYCGEDGLAVSGSGEFVGELEQRTSGTHQQQHREGYEHEMQSRVSQIPALTRKDRPRSSSIPPTPTFLLSPNDNEQSTRGHSSYPRTTLQSQHHLSPSQIPSPRADKTRKPSSRSPVIPQIDTMTIPAALRRHSVYHRSPSPNNPPFNDSGDTPDKRMPDRRTSATNMSKPQRESSQQRREGGGLHSSPYAAAARERKAYGIPPSDSVGAYLDRRSLPHADSDLSSVGSVYWDEDSDSELSPAAETLFKKLGGSQAKGDRRSYQPREEKPSRLGGNSRGPSPSYAVPSADDHSQNQGSSPRRDDRRARFHLPSPPPPPVNAAENQVDDTEMRRQDLILEIYQTEEAFVKRLQVFVELLVLPLRVQDSKSWISGVPTEIARLFDWLEDIVVLHSQILSSLQSTRAAQYPVVERIAESIRPFVPRLEVYQPYLVKLGDAVTLIDQLMQDEHSDFGEFLHIQEAAPECDGWNFQSFLVEPVNLLYKLLEFFSRLLELTPRSHQDYLSTFSLVHSTEMFIRVMTEVKAREDEYDLIQGFAARISGLPPSAQLATRDRRLLYQGTLNLIDVEANEPSAAPGSSRISRYFPPGSLRSANTANRTSKLGTALNPWDTGRARSGSASSGASFSSFRTSSSGVSSHTPATPDSPFFSSFRIPMPKGRLNQARLPNIKMPASPSPAPRTSSSTPSHGTPIQVFVFTDLVVLAAPVSTSSEVEEWTLLKHIGTMRPLDVQVQEKDAYDPNTITIEALAVDSHKLNQATTMDDGSIFLLRLAVPSDDASAHTDDGPPASDRETARDSWISAFRRCQKFTICSLSTPSRSHDPQLDTAFDEQQTVLSLLASGLPLPKSPSVQMADVRQSMARGGEGAVEAYDATMQEREERGWWSLRFQQVFREVQRRDLVLALADVF
ncbi:hypothetical protein FPV67DRAFT_1782886 [Lyophyllum atratum]|nr:hypothetical protein FPV67DRAFT_1782886 [Lyophyllum atratum]